MAEKKGDNDPKISGLTDWPPVRGFNDFPRKRGDASESPGGRPHETVSGGVGVRVRSGRHVLLLTRVNQCDRVREVHGGRFRATCRRTGQWVDGTPTRRRGAPVSLWTGRRDPAAVRRTTQSTRLPVSRPVSRDEADMNRQIKYDMFVVSLPLPRSDRW